MNKIAITTSSFAKDKPEILKLIPPTYEILMNPHGRTVKTEELVQIAAEAVGIIAGTEKYDSALLSKLPHLKIISRVGVGMESIDMAAAKALGIKVVNTPDGPTQAVAELVIGLILSLLRKTYAMDRELRQGNWKKEMGNLLSGKTVGIVGMGRIGRRVAELVAAFGAKVVFTDVAMDVKFQNATQLPLNELLKGSDIVTLHCSAKGKLIGVPELQVMKKGSWLINAARGTLIDETALVESLKNGHLAGVSLDVFEQEPYSGPLTRLQNVILTPHIGSYATESRVQMESDAIKNLLEGLKE